MGDDTVTAPKERPPDVAEEPLRPISSVDPPPDTPWRRARRYGRRLAATAALVGGLYVAYAYALAPVIAPSEEVEAVAPAEDEGAAAQADPTPEPPPRPEIVPERIPQWAWALNEWHSTPAEERGPRPEDAPRRVPQWYWEWREWREGLAADAGT